MKDIAPVAEAVKYCLRGMGRRKWMDHERSFGVMTRYCVTPPVTPVWKQEKQMLGRGYDTPTPRLCIACGKVHVTSEYCGREPPERHFRTAVPRRHDGYSLQRAANMGMFVDADNWD